MWPIWGVGGRGVTGVARVGVAWGVGVVVERGEGWHGGGGIWLSVEYYMSIGLIGSD